MKKQTILPVVVALVVISALGLIFVGKRADAPTKSAVVSDYKNITYTIEGQPVTLVNGHSSTPPKSGITLNTVTNYFGNDATGDLNGDGMPDVAFILTQSAGGRGTFYYIAVAIKTATGYTGTNAVFLGDRIAPQTTEIKDGEVVVNYADRKDGEPMTATPSVGVSKYFKIDGVTLSEVVKGVGAGEHCGGNMMNAPQCASGYHCAPVPGSHLPFGDVGGVCIIN